MKTFTFIRWACYFIVLFKLSETTFSDLVGVFFIIILLLDFLLWSIALVNARLIATHKVVVNTNVIERLKKNES